MTTTQRFLWGGIGGLAPILATFLILEGAIIGHYLSELAGGGRRSVTLGVRSEGRVVVVEGLEEGERVVSPAAGDQA